MDLPVDAYVPGDYVPYEAAKIEMHRRVAGAREVAELIVLREELEDRFGPVPEPLDNLIRAPGRPHQARPRRRPLGRLPRRPDGGDPDRARLEGRQGAARARARDRLRVRPQHRPGARARGRRRSASAPW